MASSNRPPISPVRVAIGAALSLAVFACVPPAEAPEAPEAATTAAPTAQPVEPAEVAVAPPSEASASAVERPTARDTPPSAPPAAPPRPPLQQIGVPSCDAYILMWNDCYQDPAAREAAQPGIDAMTKAWRAAAAQGGAVRQALDSGCQTAMDSFPKDACR